MTTRSTVTKAEKNALNLPSKKSKDYLHHIWGYIVNLSEISSKKVVYEKNVGKVKIFSSPMFRLIFGKSKEESKKTFFITITTRNPQVLGKVIIFGKLKVRIVEFIDQTIKYSHNWVRRTKFVYRVEVIK